MQLGMKLGTPGGGLRLRLLLRAFESRNYRLFFAGQSVSLVGTWMQQVAMSWLVYRLTGSAVLLGLVGFANQIPAFLLAPLAGVLADRLNRRSLLLCTQSLAMAQAVVLAAIVLSGKIQIWHILGLSLFLGSINAFDIPVRQSFLVELVEKKEFLANAIALNSSMFTSARLIGPSIAGLLVASLGEGICFVINAMSYLAVIIAIAAMRIEPTRKRAHKKHVLVELSEGFTYALGFPPIRYILSLIALLSLMGLPYGVLMPIFAKEVLHGDAHTFGFLMAAVGAGAFVSTIFLASRTSVLGLGRVIVAAAGVFGLGVLGFAFSRNMVLSLIFLGLAGFGAMAQIASCNTILQTIVDDDKRGRIMSLFTLSFMGLTPIGSLMAGTAASVLGVQATLVIGGMACLSGGVLFGQKIPVMRELVRPIYARMGIIPEVAIGLQAATEVASPPEKRE